MTYKAVIKLAKFVNVYTIVTKKGAHKLYKIYCFITLVTVHCLCTTDCHHHHHLSVRRPVARSVCKS